MSRMQSGTTELFSGGPDDRVSSCPRFHLDCGRTSEASMSLRQAEQWFGELSIEA